MNKTRRGSIVEALVDKLKSISLSGGYSTDLGEQAYSRMIFWDEISEFPCICVVAGAETIVHQGAGLKDRYLNIILRAYVKDEYPTDALERLLEDIEFIIDNNGRLAYTDSSGVTGTTRDIVITFIDTDQGALSPLGIGEMTLQVKY